MASSTYKVFNIGHTKDNRFWALQDLRWCRKIVTIAEVENFSKDQIPNIAVRLLRYYGNEDDFYINQMTEVGDIPMPMRVRMT